MFQRGPGEGYHAAKSEALRVEPRLTCSRAPVRRATYCVSIGPGHPTIGRGRLARDAWSDAFFKMGGRFVKGRADYSGAKSPYPREKS